jgi:hypothetical protein
MPAKSWRVVYPTGGEDTTGRKNALNLAGILGEVYLYAIDHKDVM